MSTNVEERKILTIRCCLHFSADCLMCSIKNEEEGVTTGKGEGGEEGVTTGKEGGEEFESSLMVESVGESEVGRAVGVNDCGMTTPQLDKRNFST